MMTKKRNGTFAASRRDFLQTAAGSVAASLVPAGARGVAGAAERSPIKIGVLNSFSKALATIGESALTGLNLYFDQIHWQSAGRKLEIVKEDDQINPQVGLEKVRKLVESDHVQVICGPTYTPVGLAMLPYLEQAKTPWFVTGAGSVAASAAKAPYMFRTCWSTWQIAAPMGTWVYHNVAKEIFLLCTDINSGHDVMRSFKSTYVALGGKILKEIYIPIGTNDYSSYLADVLSVKPPATYSFFGGSDSVRFVKQYAEYGLKAKIPMTGFQSLLDNDTFGAQGDAALGGLSSSIYTPALKSAENQAFVAAYQAKYRKLPTVFAATAYTTARIIDDALKATGGDVENTNKFAAAVRATKIDVLGGPFSFDPKNQLAIRNVYVLRAEKVKGEIVNVPIDTIEQVRDPDSMGG
jgi:branched-chain amino acid transport system substrate-binding protein